MWPGRESLGTAVLGVACWLIISARPGRLGSLADEISRQRLRT
jgi:hypothetical protein